MVCHLCWYTTFIDHQFIGIFHMVWESQHRAQIFKKVDVKFYYIYLWIEMLDRNFRWFNVKLPWKFLLSWLVSRCFQNGFAQMNFRRCETNSNILILGHVIKKGLILACDIPSRYSLEICSVPKSQSKILVSLLYMLHYIMLWPWKRLEIPFLL